MRWQFETGIPSVAISLPILENRLTKRPLFCDWNAIIYPLHSLGLCRWRSYWTSCFHSQLVQAEPVQLGSTDPGINSRANPGSIHQNAVLDKRGTRLDLSPLTSRETCWSCRDLPLFDRRPAALTILYSLVWYLSNYSLSWTEIIITGYTYPKSRFIKTRFSG